MYLIREKTYFIIIFLKLTTAIMALDLIALSSHIIFTEFDNRTEFNNFVCLNLITVVFNLDVDIISFLKNLENLFDLFVKFLRGTKAENIKVKEDCEPVGNKPSLYRYRLTNIHGQ